MLKQQTLDETDWVSCLPACLVGLRFYQHKVLGIAPFTVCHGMMPRVPVKGLLASEGQTFDYNEHEVELFVDELVVCMSDLHAQIKSKLVQNDLNVKRKYDVGVEQMAELSDGDVVMMKNRASGSLESKFVGPFEFVRYKDEGKYAVILRDATGREFDCAVTHIVPVFDGDEVKRSRLNLVLRCLGKLQL